MSSTEIFYRVEGNLFDNLLCKGHKFYELLFSMIIDVFCVCFFEKFERKNLPSCNSEYEGKEPSKSVV